MNVLRAMKVMGVLTLASAPFKGLLYKNSDISIDKKVVLRLI